MTTADILTIIGAITVAVTTIAAAIGSLVISIITAGRTAAKLDIVAARTDAKLDSASDSRKVAEGKLDTIHALTNANYAAVKLELQSVVGKNDILLERVASMEKQLVEKATAATIAASTAAAAAVAIAAIKAETTEVKPHGLP